MLLSIKAGRKLVEIETNGYVYADEDGKEEVLDYPDIPMPEKVKFVLPVLLPSIIACGGTIAAGVIDKKIDSKRIKDLSSLYSLAVFGASAYKDKLKEINPKAADEVDAELQKADISDKLTGPWNETPEMSNHEGEILFIDTLTGRQFYSTLADVKMAIHETQTMYNDDAWNKKLVDDYRIDISECYPPKCLSMNDFYHNLGIEMTWFGQVYGWFGEYDKDAGIWTGNGDHIKINLKKVNDKTYTIDYSDSVPQLGWSDYID